jgi:hypothetical protein
MTSFQISIVGGPVVVAYRRHRLGWMAMALQFSLIGLGRTREEAFEELKGVLLTYLKMVLEAKGSARLFNPAEAEDWDTPDQERFYLAVQGKIMLPRRTNFGRKPWSLN